MKDILNFYNESRVRIEDTFVLSWQMKGIGFGQLTFYEKDGKLHCDSERMSKKFIKHILSNMVDEAIVK